MTIVKLVVFVAALEVKSKVNATIVLKLTSEAGGSILSEAFVWRMHSLPISNVFTAGDSSHSSDQWNCLVITKFKEVYRFASDNFKGKKENNGISATSHIPSDSLLTPVGGIFLRLDD